MDRRTTKTTHYSLVALICVLIVTFALGMGGVATAGQDVAKTDAVSGFSKVGNFDMETLRQQYFSQTAVQETTASYSGKRWVIVELEGDSLFTSYENRGYWYGDFTTYCNSEEGKLLKADIEASHKDFLAVLDNNRIDYKYKYSYSTLNNGVALKVDADTFNEIKKLDGVKSVYYSESYAIPTVAVSNNANVYTTGIYDSSNLSYKGEGMVVAVLDTGLDYSHEAFATMPSNPAWTKEYVAAKMAASTRFNAQATVDEVYYNSKVPFAYDYADDDADVYPSYSTHGTHVAGIVAGKSDYVVNKETDETFVGVAPEAQLVICKVFTDNLDSDSLGGADTIDIIAAVSDCVELGVDVINMSLGSSAGFSDEKSDELINEVYNRVRVAGISLVVAASNDYSSGFGGGNGTNLASNPDSGTVGSPSTYGAALSVASINGQKATFIQANNDENQVAFITESSDANGNEYDFVERLYNIAGKSKGDTLNFKYVVVGGVGRATNYTSKIRRELQDKTGYDGTIALIKRGDTTFADKVQTAMDNGADAVIIYNNLSGTIRMSLGDVNNPVPTCSIPMDAGKVFVEKADKGVGSVQINSEFKAGPFMSDFSSWGPTPDLQLKPEITAHGGEITSAVPGGYDVYSGTSMAAPNMSGAVALLRQHLKTANPTLTGVELNARVNQVLMSTATIALNDEGNPYSPRKQDATFADSTVFVGSSEKTGYVVTFKKTSSDSDPVIAVVEKTNGKLAADQIPAALTYEDGSVFAGWYTSAGVKATADLAITADTTFIAKSVKESDYAGAWVSTEAGKEMTLLVADGKLTFGEIKNVAYTFNEDGSISYGKNRDNSAKYSVVLTVDGIKATYRHLDSNNEYYEEDVYTMTALKAISGVAGSYKSDNAHRYVITENGLVTTAENTGNVFMGYVTGSSKSNFTIVYKTSSSSKVTTVKGARIDAKGNLVLGKITADAEILIKDLKGFKSYYMSDEGTLYVYTNSDDTITYVFKTYSGKCAYVKAEDINGKVAEGEIFTITYGLYNGTYKKTNTTQTYKIVNGKLTTAGAEKGEYTAEGKDALTLNGFGSATIGEKAYSYIINKNNVVVLKSDSETIGVTLDSKAKTYAIATSDGFARSYIDVNSSKASLVFDGFGGMLYTYASSYGSPTLSYGTYTLGTGTVTIKGASYNYNKTYSIEESGNVLASVDGKVVLAVAGYVVESKIDQFKGYWVNGSDTIEITLDSSNNASVSINGAAAIKAKANWNGSILTYTAADSDNSNSTWKTFDTEYTLKIVDGKLVVSHFCAVGIDEEPIYSDTATVVNYEAGSKAMDGVEGTYKKGSDVIVLDGQGNGTYTTGGKTYNFTYTVSGSTINVSNFYLYDDDENTFTVTSTGITVKCSGDYGNYSLEGDFTKEA